MKLLFIFSGACCMLPVFSLLFSLAILNWVAKRISPDVSPIEQIAETKIIGKCSICSHDVKVNGFKDDVSKKVWDKLQMCQQCQDKNEKKGKV